MVHVWLAVAFAWIGLTGSPPETGAVLTGTVADSLTGHPIPQVSVRLAGTNIADLTDADGRFVLEGVERGVWQLQFRRTGYEFAARRVEVSPGDDSLRVGFHLQPRVYPAAELQIHADRVVPLTAGEETRYTLSRHVMAELGLDDPLELAGRLPGAVLLGSRAFFRGAGAEHVLPLLDGMPIRDPLRGDWIVPPPDALDLAEFTPSAFDARFGQALGGVFSVTLPGGAATHRFRAAVETDRFPGRADSRGATDIARFTAVGPLPVRGLSYTASWQGDATDGAYRYDRDRPSLHLAGTPVGRRMKGDATGIARLSWRSAGGGQHHTLTFLDSEVRQKSYHHHYSRCGWVGWNSQYDRYTTYVDPASDSTAVFYQASAHVPTRSRTSRLLQQTNALRLGSSVEARFSFRGADHRYGSRAEGLAFASDEEAIEWVRERTTRLNHQEEPFFSTHGDYPEYEEGSSAEAAAQADLAARFGGHEVSAGAGLTSGRHRFLASRPLVQWTPFGSTQRQQYLRDAFVYLQDVWWSDVHSSMSVGLRWDRRGSHGYLGDVSITSFSPHLGFRQPFSDRDALHVQYGVLHQFPPLVEHFLRSATLSPSEVEWRAQSSRAFEMGLQHHFSTRAVLYVTVFRREYADLVFAAREAAEEDALFPGATSRPATLSSESQGIEVVLDHQFHHAVSGQFRAGLDDESIEGTTAPWSRRASVSGWTTARPARDLSVTLFGRWDAGQPYSVCLLRYCREEEKYRGVLPDLFELDLVSRWSPGGDAARVHLNLEVRNLLNRRIASFNFGIYSSNVGVGNFIAYYDRFGRPGGYLTRSGSTEWATHIDNPQTLSEGRTVRLGIAADW